MTQLEFIVELNETDVKEFLDNLYHNIKVQNIDMDKYYTSVHELNGRVAFWFFAKHDNHHDELHHFVRKLAKYFKSTFVDIADGRACMIRRNMGDSTRKMFRTDKYYGKTILWFDDMSYIYDSLEDYRSRA